MLPYGGGRQQQKCRAGNRLQGPALTTLQMKNQMAEDSVKRAGRESKNNNRSRRGRGRCDGTNETGRTNRGLSD